MTIQRLVIWFGILFYSEFLVSLSKRQLGLPTLGMYKYGQKQSLAWIIYRYTSILVNGGYGSLYSSAGKKSKQNNPLPRAVTLMQWVGSTSCITDGAHSNI